MKTHGLKTIQPYFDQVKNGTKTAELRKNDRDFKVGDYILLQEYEYYGTTLIPNGRYTTNAILAEITDVCHYPAALKDGWVMLSFKRLEDLP